jgi:AcrR family transcriptional regulator
LRGPPGSDGTRRALLCSQPSRPLIPDPDAFAEQKQLVEAALRLRRADRTPLTVDAACAEAGVDESVFHAHFDDPDALLPAFYDLVVDQYHLLTGATTDYDEFTFEERLASFYYILLDTLGEQRAFVQATFDTEIRYASSLRSDVRAALRDLFTDDRIPQTNQLVTGLWPVQAVLTEVTVAVIRHWITDETDDQAATTALVDKLVAFLAELVTFRGVSTGVELAWHVVQHDALGLRRLPVVGWLFPGRKDSSTD